MIKEKEPFTCGGFNPYNSATTSAKWMFALAYRDGQRMKKLLNFLYDVFGELGTSRRRKHA